MTSQLLRDLYQSILECSTLADFMTVKKTVEMIVALPASPTDNWVPVPPEFIDFVKGAPVASGVCCCGDDMEHHSDPMSCGHSPVDQWDYSLSKWIEQIKPAERARTQPWMADRKHPLGGVSEQD